MPAEAHHVRSPRGAAEASRSSEAGRGAEIAGCPHSPRKGNPAGKRRGSAPARASGSHVRPSLTPAPPPARPPSSIRQNRP
jgi:hypothetical protein